jgi:hypothetical protein
VTGPSRSAQFTARYGYVRETVGALGRLADHEASPQAGVAVKPTSHAANGWTDA